MRDFTREAKDFYESFSEEELLELLTKAGFEIEQGDGTGEGKVIFTDNFTVWYSRV